MNAAAVAGSTLAALLTARLLAVVAVGVPPGAGALPADDVAIAALCAFVAGSARGLCRTVLAVAVTAIAALHVLVVHALGRPFVPTMAGGVDVAMVDSLAPYVTIGNGVAVALVVAAAFVGALVARRVELPRWRWLTIAAFAAGIAALLPAPAHCSHRNAFVAFGRALLPRNVPAAAPSVEPRLMASPSPVHGVAAGRSVVIVVLESAAARFVAPSDGSASAMPCVRELAANGLECTNAYATYPDSIEGQVALFCGMAPIPDAAPTRYERHGRLALPHRLRPAGYRSALFHAGRFRFLGMQHVLAPMGFDELADAARIGGDEESSFGVGEAATVDTLLAWVDAQPRSQRVLACWLPIAGHHPYSSPEPGPFGADTQLGCLSQRAALR